MSADSAGGLLDTGEPLQRLAPPSRMPAAINGVEMRLDAVLAELRHLGAQQWTLAQRLEDLARSPAAVEAQKLESSGLIELREPERLAQLIGQAVASELSKTDSYRHKRR